MKKAEIVRANSALMIAIMFIDLDDSHGDGLGHPRARPVRVKIAKILQNFNNARNGKLNIRANQMAEATLQEVQKRIKGTVDVNVVAMCILTELEDLINLPKLYNLPSKLIVDCINELADINTVDIFGRSSDTAEEIIKELGYVSKD